MDTKIKIAIAEDQSILRKRLVEHFKFFSEIDVVLVAESGDALSSRLGLLNQDQRPEIVLMDIEMPGSTGIETTRTVKRQFPDIDVLMFTVFEDDERIFDAIQSGASGYLLKDEPIDQIVQAIHDLKKGGAPMSTLIGRKLLDMMRQVSIPRLHSDQRPIPFDLSAREIEIIQHVVEGKTNAEIGRELFLSPFTIKTHVKNIYKKMHVNSRAEATRVAMKLNLA